MGYQKAVASPPVGFLPYSVPSSLCCQADPGLLCPANSHSPPVNTHPSQRRLCCVLCPLRVILLPRVTHHSAPPTKPETLEAERLGLPHPVHSRTHGRSSEPLGKSANSGKSGLTSTGSALPGPSMSPLDLQVLLLGGQAATLQRGCPTINRGNPWQSALTAQSTEACDLEKAPTPHPRVSQIPPLGH